MTSSLSSDDAVMACAEIMPVPMRYMNYRLGIDLFNRYLEFLNNCLWANEFSGARITEVLS